MSWIQDIFEPRTRNWEDFYRNRWSHDRVVRSTHGVNCTGSCSWNIYVKQGIITWEMQALDYPRIDPTIPPYEPRGCQRGISCSWYIYSPMRIKYPTARGVLLDLWRAARKAHPEDPVAAWGSIMEDPEKRASIQRSRGKGGFRRASWDEVNAIMAAANVYTIKKHGPDRIVGFSPIPAMSMISYASGARFLQLLGGVCLSFYDWYCDLPPASPEVWGEQTDVAESADWYKSKLIAVVGSNVLMTRTPDAHFLVEARHQGAKVVVFSPDFSQTSKIADEWLPIHQGQDGAFWMAVNHVLLKEFYADRQVPFFIDYLKRYTDAPFLVRLEKDAEGRLRPGRLLRASDLAETQAEENAEWKLLLLDEASGELRMPMGTGGHRWQKAKGQWNLKREDARTGEPIDPSVTLEGRAGERALIALDDFSESDARVGMREVPAMSVETIEGPVLVTTGLDLLMAQFGVRRGEAAGEWPADYGDMAQPYTPAWQERFTGIAGDNVVRFAREWGATAEKSRGRCSIIIGAGVNHWYHNNLIYRACIHALMLTGCVGRNGGGLNHYVGQEKLVPISSWAPIAFGTDWGGPPRLQNAPSFHYVNSDQWRYDRPFQEMTPVSEATHPLAAGHTIDRQITAVRHGWLPCYPQFNRHNFEVVQEARDAGAASDEAIVASVVEQLKTGKLKFAMEDPDAPECWPRVWYIWRGNALQASAKGHEYFLKHYLGTHNNLIAEEDAKGTVEEVTWHDKVDLGKLDLVVDLNFRMDTSALYSDIVLPAASWYEKDDLSSTDMHSFIHPLQAAVPPCWESRSDWAIFRELALHTQRVAERHFPHPVKEIVATPIMHDTPGEMAQPSFRDWHRGECEPVPGKTMPNLTVVERDYSNLFQRFITLGRKFRDGGLGVHGTRYEVADLYDAYVQTHPVEDCNGSGVLPSLRNDRDVCEAILHFAPETNGELAWRAWQSEGQKTGIDHSHMAQATRGVKYDFADLAAQPRRVLTTPYWTGITNDGRTYSGFCQNVEELIPWRTLTGRQHFYLDHEAYRAWGEHLPTFKPRPGMAASRDLVHTPGDARSLTLNYLTPHGKWHIHSTFGDTLRMNTLSRGIEPVWLCDADAERAGIVDNDWVELLNDHGAVVTRACVSARIPRGLCFIYHATERTLGVPKSPGRGDRRAGGHNSLTRARLKPLFMIGGYAQFSYAFNYWGPQGVNRDTWIQVRKIEEPKW